MRYPVLLTHYGKYGDRHIVANNKDEEAQAWLAMFRAMNEWDGFYYPEDMYGDEPAAYRGACEGRAGSAQWLLQLRSDYEYERVELECVDTPETLLEKLNAKRD